MNFLLNSDQALRVRNAREKLIGTAALTPAVKLQLPTAGFVGVGEDPIRPLVRNCNRDLTPCTHDSDCVIRCSNNNYETGTNRFVCRDVASKQQRFGNTEWETRFCLPSQAKHLSECNYDHGGRVLMRYDSSLEEMVPDCICLAAYRWSGPNCNTPNPRLCSGPGANVRDDDTAEACECTDPTHPLLVKLEALSSTAFGHYRCISRTERAFLQQGPLFSVLV